MIKELIDLNFLKDNLMFNQSTIKNRTLEQNNFLKELYERYSFLEEYKLSYLINILKKYKPEDCKCIINSCNHAKLYIPNHKRLRLSCKEHIKHPDVIQVSKKNRKEKTQKTNLEKYGVKNISQLKNIKLKKEETSLKNFGVRNPQQLIEIKEKRKQNYFEKTGYSNPRKNPEVIQKTKNNCIKKYGYSHYMKNPELKKEFFNKQLLKKGYMYSRQQNRKNPLDLNKKFIEENFIDEKTNTFKKTEFDKYFNFNSLHNDGHTYLKKFNITYTKLTGTSRAEEEIIKYILSLKPDIKIIKNSRNIIKPYELDIYLPEYNLAFEYNGLYWHSYGLNNVSESQGDYLFQRSRHKEKTELCENKNINLFHIFENDWWNKKEIIKSMIKNKLKLNYNKIYARKCQIQEIDSKTTNIFLKENHIQGSSNSQYRYGLFFNDELISVMTFSKSRYNKNYDFELIRFCSKKNYNIIGAAGKLLKNFQRLFNYPSIISYGNRTFSSTKNNVYLSLGFKHIKNNNPDLKFVSKDCSKLIPREYFMKHKLKNIPDFIYTENLSVNDNIINNGYRILHGPGTAVYILKDN